MRLPRTLAMALLFVVALARLCPASEMPGYAGNHLLADVVSDECVFYTCMPSPGETVVQMRALAPWGLVNDPEVVAFLDSGQAWLDEALTSEFRTTADRASATAAEFIKVFDRQVALALLLPDRDEDEPDYVVLLESGRPAEEVADWFTQVVDDRVLERYLDAELTRVDLDGVEAYAVEAPGSLPMSVGLFGQRLAVASSAELLQQALVGDGGEGSLAATPEYAAALRAVTPEDTDFFMLVRPAAIWTRALEENPRDEETQKAAELLGFQSIAGAVVCRDGRAHTRVHLAPEPGNDRTLLRFVSRAPNPFETLDIVPDRAVVYSSVGLDVGALAGEILGSDDLMREMFSLRQAEDAARRALVEQAVASLAGGMKDEMAMFVQLPFGGGMFPEAALMGRTRDPAQMEDDIVGLLKLGGVGTAGAPFLGTRIYPLVAQSGFGPFAPTAAVIGRNVTVSYAPQALKTMIRIEQSGKGLLRDKEEFRAVFDGAPRDAVLVHYIDVRPIVLYAYNTLTPFFSMMSQETMSDDVPPFDFTLLPSAEAIAQYLTTVVAHARWDGDAMAVEVHSDGLDGVSLMAHAHVYAPYFMPFVCLARRAELRDQCKAQLWGLRFPGDPEPGLAPFEREEAPPADLPDTQLAFLKEFMAGKSPVCPADDEPTALGDGVETSFHYFPEQYGVKVRLGMRSLYWGEQPQTPPMASFDTILLYEDAPRHMGGRNVLTPRGPKWMPEDEFQDAIAAQADRFGASR